MSARLSIRSRKRRAGFTLLELMVALAIGALVVATMYTLSGASARSFQTQQRISQLQLQTRLTLERIRRDVASTGFGGTPDSQAERTCGSAGIATTSRLLGVDLQDNSLASALSGIAGASRAAVQADRLRLMGNFVTSDNYLIANTGGASGSSILLQSNWQGFRRTFASNPLGTQVDPVMFQSVFAPGRILHITHPRGFHFFTQITGSSVDASGTTPSITISPPLPALDECNFALCVGCRVSPQMMIEYNIADAATIAPGLVPNDMTVTGPNTVLYRRELNPQTGNVDPNLPTARTILEFAIHFNIQTIYDQSARGGIINLSAPVATFPLASTSRLRALQVDIAARTPDTDPSFPFPYPATRAAADPLNSILVFGDGRPGSARVRRAMAEFVLDNFVDRGL